MFVLSCPVGMYSDERLQVIRVITCNFVLLEKGLLLVRMSVDNGRNVRFTLIKYDVFGDGLHPGADGRPDKARERKTFL